MPRSKVAVWGCGCGLVLGPGLGEKRGKLPEPRHTLMPLPSADKGVTALYHQRTLSATQMQRETAAQRERGTREIEGPHDRDVDAPRTLGAGIDSHG